MLVLSERDFSDLTRCTKANEIKLENKPGSKQVWRCGYGCHTSYKVVSARHGGCLAIKFP